jgi:hypothetical protein
MVIEAFTREHRAIEERLHPVVTIIDQGERRHGARGDAQDLLEQFRPAERQARAAEHLGQAIDVDPPLAQADQQLEPALSVLEEEVLAVAAGYVAGMPLGLLDGVDGWMVDRRVGDAQLVEAAQELGPVRPA